MKKKVVFFMAIVLFSTISFAQNRIADEEKIAKSIYNILSENKHPKDSLLIYALNFELHISRKKDKALASSIVANDSLAYEMFPAYKKLKTIDFMPIMREKNTARIIIPVLVYGGSEMQKKYKDKEGRGLISFNAAINAVMALNDINNYSNENDAEKPLSHRLYKQKNNNVLFIDAIFMKPYIIEIFNIE